MKKVFSLIFALILLVTALAGCGARDRAEQNEVQDLTKDTKVLVVYFSWS